MSLAEFALQSSRNRINHQSSIHSNVRRSDCIEIKSIVDQINDERKKNDITSNNRGISANRNNEDSPSPLLSSKDLKNDVASDSCESLDDFFKIMHNASGSNSSTCDKDDDHKSSLRPKSMKRQRPWTAPQSHHEICSTRPNASKSCSLVTPPGMSDVQIFCVDPDMMQIIQNFDVPQDDNGIIENKTTPNKGLLSLQHLNLSMKLMSGLDVSNFAKLDKINFTVRPRSAMTVRSRKRDESKLLQANRKNNQCVMQEILQSIEDNRIQSFHLRDERIENAKQRRYNLRNYQLNKLEENLRRKEQQRLDHLSMKKKQDRQILIITTIVLVSTTYGWLSTTPKIIEEYRYSKLLNDAARKIQTLWKKEMFSRKAMEAKMIQTKLKSLTWKIQLWFQCSRRRLNAQIIRQLFSDFASNPLPYLIFEFRRKVITAQKMMRSFIECKRARIIALELCWVKLEKEVLAEISSMKQRRKKNALSEIAHRKVLPKGENHMLEEKSGFINVVNEVTQRALGHGHKERASLDAHFCKLLCRTHLEDSRRSHMKFTGQRKVNYGPNIHLDHAVILLAGKDLKINNFSIARQWPLFSLFLKQKNSFRNLIKDAYRDEAKCRRNMDMRIDRENNMEFANRFAAHSSNNMTNDVDDTMLNNFEVEATIMKELRVIFQLIDLDCNDKLSSEEIGKLFFVLGYDNENDYTPVDSLTNDIHGGDLDYKTFISTLNKCSKKHTKYTKETVLAAFQYFEKGIQGKIHGEELLNILQSYKGKWDKECAYKMVKNAGLSTSKFIDYREFVSNLFGVWNCEGVSEILKLGVT